MSGGVLSSGNPPEAGRYQTLDILRGFLVLNMVCYHGLYDLVYVKGVSIPWFPRTPGYLWQQCICWGFILLSGFCWGLSRRHWQRGLLLTCCGAVITLATYLVMPSELIQYGILTLLGLSALLLIPLDKLFQKAGFPDEAGLILSFLLFVLLRGVPQRYLGFEGLRLVQLPDALYTTDLMAVLGFHAPSFFSTDYFPLIPWFFLYLTGYFLRRTLSRREKAKRFLRGPDGGFGPLSWIGRHSLLIYLLHQPLLMAVFWLL